MPSKQSNEIVGLFQRYQKNGDDSEINKIPIKQLRIALDEYAAYTHDNYYPSMERRYNELIADKHKWRDRIITFILGGLILPLIVLLLANIFKLN